MPDIDTSGSGANLSQTDPGYINQLDLKNAAAVYQAYMAGLTSTDSLTEWLAQAQGQGPNSIRTFSSKAGSPTLAQMEEVFGPQGNNAASYQASVKQALQYLIAQLPIDVQTQLLIYMNLDPAVQAEPQYAQYAGLLQVLETIAPMVVAETTVQAVQSPPPPDLWVATTTYVATSVVAPLTVVSQYLAATINTAQSNEVANSMIGYLTLIRVAIQNAMQLIEEMGTLDSQNDQVIAQAQMELTAARLKETMQQIADARAAAEKQAEMSLVMKICMPIITAVMVAVDIAVSVVTAGTGTAPMAIATSVALGSIALALSVADSCTGFITNAMEAGFKSLMSKLPSDRTERIFAELAIIVGFAIICALVSKGGTAGSGFLAKQMTKEIADEVAQEAAQEASANVIKNAFGTLWSQFAVTALTSSNIITDLVQDMTPNNNSELSTWLSTVLQTLAVLIIILAALGGKGSSSGGVAKAAQNEAWMRGVEIGGKILQSAATLGQAGLGFYSGITQLQIADILEDQKNAEQALALINNYIQAYGMDIKNLQDAMQDAFDSVNGFNNLWNAIILLMSNMMNQISFSA